MRKYLTALIVAGSVFSLFATDARIKTMGGTDHFFKDDWSIYRNAATIGSYDKMLIGSFGVYSEDSTIAGDNNNQMLLNRDAKKPFFGGTASFKKSDSSVSKFIIGAVFNRYDTLLSLVLPEYDNNGVVTNNNFLGYPVDKDGVGSEKGVEYLGETVGKFDLLVGYTLPSKLTIGLGGYLAFQSDKVDEADGALTRVVKGNIGISGPVADNIDLEASIALGAISLIGRESQANGKSANTVSTLDNNIAFQVDARLFADAPALNGAFVPHIQANVIQLSKNNKLIDFNGGLGINAYIDRGFIWGGLEGFFYDNPEMIVSGMTSNDVDTIAGVPYTAVNRVGGKVAFGIERNVLTDWLIWRVGATKVLGYETFKGGNAGSHWIENPEDDHVSFGLGVNIEDRFKVDAVVAENLLYTFTNLVSGNSHHFSSRISATFNF